MLPLEKNVHLAVSEASLAELFLSEEFALLMELFWHPVTDAFSSSVSSARQLSAQSGEGLQGLHYVLGLLPAKRPEALTFNVLSVACLCNH